MDRVISRPFFSVGMLLLAAVVIGGAAAISTWLAETLFRLFF